MIFFFLYLHTIEYRKDKNCIFGHVNIALKVRTMYDDNGTFEKIG